MPFLPRPTPSLKLTCSPFQPIFRYGGQRAPGARASRIAAFAIALQTRYGERFGGGRNQGLVYRRLSLGRFVNRIYRPIQLTLAPRLQLSFQIASHRAPLAPASLSLPSSPIPALKPTGISVWRRGSGPLQEGEYHPLEIRQAVQETTRLSTQIPIQMIQRLAARLERVETIRYLAQVTPPQGSQAITSSARFTQPMPRALPVPQVNLKWMQAIRLEEAERSEPRSQNANRRQSSLATMPEFTPSTATDMNVQRLADQVVQVINDRVTARQERLGRI